MVPNGGQEVFLLLIQTLLAFWAERMLSLRFWVLICYKKCYLGILPRTEKNKRTMPDKLEMKKYDPVARKHVIYKEAKIK